MARDKKGKKSREEETSEEVVVKGAIKESHDIPSAGSSVKKLKNGKERDWVNNIAEEMDSLSLGSETSDHKGLPKDKNTKQKKKGKACENGDLDASENHSDRKLRSHTQAKDHTEKDAKERKKASKKEKSIDMSVNGPLEVAEQTLVSVDSAKLNPTKINEKDVEYEEEETEKASGKSKKKKKKESGVLFDSDSPVGGKSSFQFLDIEGDNSESEASEMEISESLSSNTKEQQKNESKKGGKKSKKKERKKKDDDDDDIDKLLEELALEMTGSQKAAEKQSEKKHIEETEPKEEAEVEVKSSKKKKAKKVLEEKDTEIEENISQTPSLQDEEQHTVKTAAQKKKEKKEKEKQKKMAQYEKSSKKLPNVESKAKQKVDEEVSVEKEESPLVDVQELNEEEQLDDNEESKKKKKKKKGEEEKKEKKRPGKKQIAAMQEALKRVQEEEERLKREEEAKIKAEEEAERLRQEKLREEQERKEKKKQKEKEKRERLKAEGKLLSKSQRQNRARMEATLAALREQGVEVPQIGEKKERAPRLGDRKKEKKKDKNENVNQVPEDQVLGTLNTSLDKDSSPEIDSEGNARACVELLETKNEDYEDVKDAWDESSDEDDSSKMEKEIIKQAKHKKNLSSADSSEESESDESETDDSDSEVESTDSETESKRNDERVHERAMERIKKRREENEIKRSLSNLRSPIVCVLGHVDTGKTKILDKIRRTHVQDSEAGGITQQIGATMVPQEALKEQCKMVKDFLEMELKVPGLLIIDTPGHESFTNLRSRGSSLCDIAILVVDIMHGLEPQTIESINLLKKKKTPFIVALNKVDRLYEWKSQKSRDIQDVIKTQARNTKLEFDERAREVILQFANQGLNAVLYYDNSDPRTYISMVPTSAMTGDGVGNLMALVVQLTQQMMAKRLSFSEELQATVLEVKAIPGLGTTIDAILVNGRLHEGDTIVLAGIEGPVVTQIRSLLMPQPMKELRVKNPYEEFKEVAGAQGVKITGKDLDKAIAGLQLLVANNPDETAILKDEVASSFRDVMNQIKLAERGVYVQASTLGSLEALLEFLKTSKIPYSGIRIGPVVKKDVMKASIMLEHDSQYAVILAFDIKVERDAQELAENLGVRIFVADIIYHLFDKFMAYREELKNKKRDEFKAVAVFPCKLRILPQFVFNSRDPIVVGVVVEGGILKHGTPLCVPSKEFLDIGTVTTIEVNHKPIESARKGQEVCIKIEPVGGDAPKLYGRHFDHNDLLVSKITRQSIDVCKEYFRDDLLKTDWQLMVELKKLFQIL